jgi:hypothetical protein
VGAWLGVNVGPNVVGAVGDGVVIKGVGDLVGDDVGGVGAVGDGVGALVVGPAGGVGTSVVGCVLGVLVGRAVGDRVGSGLPQMQTSSLSPTDSHASITVLA